MGDNIKTGKETVPSHRYVSLRPQKVLMNNQFKRYSSFRDNINDGITSPDVKHQKYWLVFPKTPTTPRVRGSKRLRGVSVEGPRPSKASRSEDPDR